MPMLETKTGPITSAAAQSNMVRSDREGNVIVVQGKGKYAESGQRGRIFVAASQASRTFTLFSTATATGLILGNDAGTGVNLVVLNIGFMRATAAASAFANLVISCGTAAVTHTTAKTIYNTFLGGSGVPTAKGLVDRAATITVGTIYRVLASPSVSDTATVGIPPVCNIDIGGSLIIAPGSFLQIAAGLTNTWAGVAHIMWEELPI